MRAQDFMAEDPVERLDAVLTEQVIAL